MGRSKYLGYKVEKTYFDPKNPKRGRTTTVTDLTTGKSCAFMGCLTKERAISNYEYQKKVGRLQL
jgi:hypothetical protein